MKSGITKPLALLTVPFGVLALSCVWLVNVETDPALGPLIGYSPYSVFLVGLVLSWWFHQGRIFFTTFALSAAYFFVFGYHPPGFDAGFYRSTVYLAVTFLLPLNILVLAFLKERGISTPRGKACFAAIFVQLALVAGVLSSGDADIVAVLGAPLLKTGIGVATPLPQLSILMFLTAFLALGARYFWRSSFLDACLAGVLTALLLAFHFNAGTATPLFFAVAGLLLVIALIHQAYAMAYLDELTGLPGRRALRQETMKLGPDYTIAMVDIDLFKQVNDRYGHAVGDQVLKFVAAALRQISGGGRPFRYGGEEFTIVFPGRTVEETAAHLEELRKAIAARPFILRGKDRPKKKPRQANKEKTARGKVKITVSIGVSERKKEHGTPEEVIQAADAALYRAKKNGRNRVAS
jgi:diguanylate cyclase (GGDEF)-like protein